MSNTFTIGVVIIITPIFESGHWYSKRWTNLPEDQAGDWLSQDLHPYAWLQSPAPNDIPSPLGTYFVLDTVPN